MLQNKKSQASFEYMSVIGVGLIILISMVAFAYTWTASSRESLSISTANNAVHNIVESANLVHAQGYPARTTIVIQIPEKINVTNIFNDTVHMRIEVKGGYTDVSAQSKANLSGSLPNTSGYYKVLIQSMGDYVNVSKVE